MIDFVPIFIFFFAVIDPIGTVPVYIAVTRHYNEYKKRKIAINATLIASGVLIFFVIAGEVILTAIDIPLSAFQVAGGIVLFLFALSMIFGESKPEEELDSLANENDTAIFPLAMPSIASPGAMLGAVLMTKNDSYSIFQQFQTTLVMISVLVIVLIFLLLATHIQRIIGNSGASIISRVMGLILSSVAAANILEGIKIYFSI